jgi:hypothetical protein
MTDKKIQMTQRNATNDGWDNLYPKTTGDQVVATDGTTFESHKADNTAHIPYKVATGSANTYAVTLSPAPAAYVDGMAVCVKINVASTGASTLNVNSLGAKTILDSLGNAITSGGLKANTPYTMRYNGTSFIVQGKGGGGTALSGDLRLGKTATVDSGQITGTLDLSNLLSQNILSGVSIAGVVGSVIPINPSAGAIALHTDLTQYSDGNSATPAAIGGKYTINYSGSIRFSFDLRNAGAPTYTTYARVYKNGSACGTLRTLTTTTITTYTEDFTGVAGDVFQIYIWCNGGYTSSQITKTVVSINNNIQVSR